MGFSSQGGSAGGQFYTADATDGVSATSHSREGEKHKHTGSDGGVHNVLTQTAEEALDQKDGKQTAHGALPQGHIGAQVEAQEHTGNHSGETSSYSMMNMWSM